MTSEHLSSAASGQAELEQYHRYDMARQFCGDKVVLDVAAGEGHGAALLASVAREVIGLDRNADLVAQAQALHGGPCVRFLRADATRLPIRSASIDVAIFLEALGAAAQRTDFLAEAKRVLRPGGLLFLGMPGRHRLRVTGLDPDEPLEAAREAFLRAIQSVFSNCEWLYQKVVVGSLVAKEVDLVGEGPVPVHERPGSRTGDSPRLQTPYLLVLASDAILPSIGMSLCLDSKEVLGAGAEPPQAEETLATLRDEIAALRIDAEQAALGQRALRNLLSRQAAAIRRYEMSKPADQAGNAGMLWPDLLARFLAAFRFGRRAKRR
jgi:hypothetical protein